MPLLDRALTIFSGASALTDEIAIGLPVVTPAPPMSVALNSLVTMMFVKLLPLVTMVLSDADSILNSSSFWPFDFLSSASSALPRLAERNSESLSAP